MAREYKIDSPTLRGKNRHVKAIVVFFPFAILLLLVVMELLSSFSSLKLTSAEFNIPNAIYDSIFSNPVILQNQEQQPSNNDDDDNDDDDDPPYLDELGPLNVVVFYPDDWKYDAIEDAQPNVVHTPFLTQLAKDGIRFTRNCVTTSICWISRATLFTGRYSSQHKSERLFCPLFTLPSIWNGSWVYMLQKYGGYFVGHIGKWQYRNKKMGSLFNFSSHHEGQHWYTVGGKKVHANDRARDDTITFLRVRPKDQNFAVTVAFYPPKPVTLKADPPGAQWSPDEAHEALYANDTFVQPYNYSDAFSWVPDFVQKGISGYRYNTRFKTSEMYQESMRHYYALVSGVDDACRDIVAELDRQGVLNRTMIIVSADNGMMLGSHGLAGKWHPYQESIRVPLIIYDPRMVKSKRGTTDDKYTLNIDLAPTIIKAANLDLDPRIQGRDLSEIYVKRSEKLKTGRNATPTAVAGLASFGVDKEPWREDFYYEFPLGEYPASTALITQQYKYIRWYAKDGRVESIFDLKNDPYELHDLTKQGPPLHLMRHVGTEYRPLNVTDLMVELRLRHDALEANTKKPYRGDERVTCQRGVPGIP